MDRETTLSSGRLPVLSDFDLLEKVGEGGTGEVYRARQVSRDRVVAVKVLRPSLLVASHGRQLDLRVLTSLRHPHVVNIFDLIATKTGSFLVMEYVKGPSLRGLLIPEQPWPVARALAIVNAVAEALTFIHGRVLLHLDLKPENILCDCVLQTIKITDFGLALLQSDVRPLTALESIQGTLDYCAPEQRFGLRVDVRTDLFALATVAYELLTGRLPGRVFVPCTQRNPRLPSGIDEVLRAGLSRDPEARPASVEEFRQAIVQALPGITDSLSLAVSDEALFRSGGRAEKPSGEPT